MYTDTSALNEDDYIGYYKGDVVKIVQYLNPSVYPQRVLVQSLDKRIYAVKLHDVRFGWVL